MATGVKSFTAKVGEVTLALPFIILLAVVLSIVNGFIIIPLWDWYVKPITHLPGLNLKEAIGLSMLIHYLTYQTQYRPRDTITDYTIMLTPLLVLLCGFIVHLF